MTSSPLWSSASKRPGFAPIVLSQSRVRKLIEAPRSGVLLKFSVPSIGIETLKPRSELRQLARRKVLDRLLDLFHGAHAFSVSASDCRSPTDLAQLRR